jgi:hypothetical protein
MHRIAAIAGTMALGEVPGGSLAALAEPLNQAAPLK